MAETTAKLLNVSEFTSVEDATSALVSSLQAFTEDGQNVAQRAEEIVDILNNIGNKYPVATNELATGLAASGAALVAANNTIEEQVALLAAGNATMQDVSSVAAGLKIVAARLRGTTTEDDDDAESAITNVSKLQDKIKSLTAEANGGEGIDIINENGEYRSTYEILYEISKIFDKMDDMSRASLLELVAGKNRSSIVAAIIQNGDILKNAYKDAFDSAGSSQRELDTQMDSLQGRINLFNNSVQTMWMNFMNSEALKFIINLGTGLIKLIDSVGVLESAFAGLLAYLSFSSKNDFDLASFLGIHKKGTSFLEGFSAFGKEGLTGWVTKLFKNKKTKDVKIPVSIEPTYKEPVVQQLDMFSDEYKNDIALNNKLAELKRAQKELKKLKNTKSKDVQIPEDATLYKAQNRRSGYLHEVLIPNKEAEIQAIQKDIQDIANAAKSSIQQNFAELENGQLSFANLFNPENSDANLNDVFANFGANALSQLDGKMIDFSDFETAAQQIDSFNAALGQGQQAFLKYLPQLNGADTALQAYLASLNGTEASLQGFQQFIAQHNAGVKASGVAAKAAAVGHQLLNAALSMGVSLLASFAINVIVDSLDKLITTTEEAADAAKNAIDAYESSQEELKKMDSNIDALSSDYQKLSAGVDEFGRNINLSTSEYERYNDIVNQIADMFPQMVRGYTSEGNAIIKNKGNVNALTEAYKALKAEANDALITSADDIMKNYNNITQGSFLGGYDTADSITAAKELDKILRNQDTYDFSLFGSAYREDYHDEIMGMLKTAGISRESGETNEEYVKRAVRDFPGIVQSIINTWNSTVNSAVSSVKPLVSAYLEQASVGYAGLAEEQKSVFDSIASSFDADFFNQFEGDASKMKQTIEAMILELQQSGIDDEYTTVLSLRTELNDNKISVGDYQSQVGGFVQELDRLQQEKILGEDNVAYIKLSLGLADDSEDNISTLIAHAQSVFSEELDEGVRKELQDKILTLNYSDLKLIDSDNFNVDGSTIATWEQLQEEIKQTKIAMTEDFTTDNFAEYAESISAIQESIVTYQEALESLESGTFTFTDFMELIAQFPELADGVDLSSKEFRGLSDNLKRAIKNSPDDLVDDLKDLRAELIAADKSTDAIDQLIESIENMPSDAVDNLTNKYSTLADEINAAKVAQTELQKAMSENPNEGYETRGEAIEAMKTLMEEGKIGSESELWSIAEAFGFTPDSAKTINENADALHKFITTREKWYATDKDGNYTYEGIESFIEYVEANENAKALLAQYGGEWSYEDGQFEFDLDNEQWEEFAKAIGLTSAEFSDLMVQIGQFFGINWGDADDALAYINRMTESIEDPKKKLEQYGKLMEQYFGEDSEIDLTKRPIVDGKQMQNRGWTEVSEDDYATVYSSAYTNSDETIAITATPILPDGKVLTPHQLEAYATEIANGADPAEYEFEVDGKTYTGEDIVLAKHEGQDAIEQANKYAEALHKVQEEYQKLLELAGEPLEINDQLTKDAATNKEKGLTEESVEAISEYASVIQDVDSGVSWVNFDELAKNAKEAGVDVTELGDHLRELQDAGKLVDLRITDDDPLGLSSFKGHVDTAVSYLNGLGVAASNIEGNLQIDLPSFVSMLQASGWTQDKVQTYIGSLLSSGDYTFSNGENVLTIETNADIVKGQVTDLYAEAENAPDEEIKVDLTGNAQTALDSIISSLAQIQDKEITVTTKKKTIFSFGFGGGGDDELNGTAHAHGTAYKSGSWGAPKTTEALVGELGPELRVRGNQWTLVGQDGAEFTDIRKGDIVFNHKQTQSLLENGYVTGRGKAYASGTAFASGGGAFTKYTFSDTDLTDASGKLSKAANDISKSADELSEDFKEVFDWIAVRIEEITEDIDLKSAKLENAVGSSKQNAIIDDMIALHQRLYDNLTAGATKYNAYASKLLAKIPAQYRQAAQDGSIAIESFTGEVGESTLEAIQDYREWVQKGADATQQAEETLTEIANLAKQAIDNIAQEYENKSSMPTIKIEQLEAYNSLIETTVGAESAKVYEEIIKANNENIKLLEQQRDKMQSELNAQVEAGNIKKYSQAWYDAINDIAAVDTEIIELTADIADYQDAINELHWDHFDNLISRLEAVSDESENLIDILGSKDLVDKDTAEWTDEGVTSLALYAQQMEVAEVQAKKYKEEINYLNKNWKKLGYTEQEYVEKLEELKNGQYDAIKSYNDTKEAIKDLTSERVDAIKRGIEKEIDAYSELIEKKKEELSAEKDLHDFQRGVADQQKEIADIERKLSALSADNSASARAQRAKLQAELAEAQQELQDTYYDRSVQDQQDALDKELEAFQKEKEEEMEGWDEYLENTEVVVSDALTTIQSNTGIVYQALQTMGKEYSLSIADAIVSPWEDGSAAIQDYSEQFKLSMSSTVEELQKLATEYKKVMAEIEGVGQEAVATVSGNTSRYTNDASSTVSKSKTQSSNTSTSSTGRTYTVQNGDSLWSIAQSQLGNGSRWQEIYNLNKNQISNPNVISKGQKLKLPQYAKGTNGVLKNQLAWIDELGEELVIRPQNGRLSFMEKGTGVIPADLTENLMEWGELDPYVMLERNRPEIKLHPEVHNTEVNITMDIAEVVHVDRVDNENMPDLTKAVEKQLDKYMKNLNNQIRRYVR